VSLQRALGQDLDAFEEGARWLPFVWQRDMDLEMRFRAAEGQSLDGQSGVPRVRQQRIRASERGGAIIVHDEVVGCDRLPDQPLFWHPWQRFAAGPASDIESFELHLRDARQNTADNERIVAAADAAECPGPRRIARFEENNEGRAGEGHLGVAYRHLDGARTEPAHRGAPAENRQAVLHPAQQRAAPTDIPGRSSGKPGDKRDGGYGNEFGHGGGNHSTLGARGWLRALREFVYGMTTYEFVQQAREMRHSMERLFLVGVFGDMLGVPILPSYYGLRLLPWVVPEIQHWKRDMLRERGLGDEHEHHLHGL